MSSTSRIPGIDDSDEEEQVAESGLKRCHDSGAGLSCDQRHEKRSRFAEVDEEDVELYGGAAADPGRAQAACMTLVTEKLPANDADFLNWLLSADRRGEAERRRMLDLLSLTGQLQQIDVTNVFQVTFMTCLCLEAEKRRRKMPDDGFRTYYPYLKTMSADMIQLHCLCSSSLDEATSVAFGQLASVRIMPIDDSGSVSAIQTLAYVSGEGRRLPDRVCRLEADLLSHKLQKAEKTQIHEIVLKLPFAADLWSSPNFHIRVAPVCFIRDLLIQSRTVYDIGVNPLFRSLQAKDFSLSTTGIQITSDDKLFTSLQLEAIQRAFDLVMQPVTDQGNPCKAVFIDGLPKLVRFTIIEIIRQLLTFDATRNHQYIVTSSENNLYLLHQLLMPRHPDLLSAKRVFFAGHEDQKIRAFSKHYLESEIRCLTDAAARQTDSSLRRRDLERKNHLQKCLSHLSLEKSHTSIPPDVQVTIDDFEHISLLYSLRSARLILGTLKQFSQSPALCQHLQSAKVYPSVEVQPEENRKVVSVSMFADAESLTDPEVMAFAKDFSISRFILSSGWFSHQELLDSGRTPEGLGVTVQHSFGRRLRQISAESNPPLVVDVGKRM